MHSLPRGLEWNLADYNSVAAFCLGALALIVPQGYALGPILMFLGCASLFWRRPQLAPADVWLLFILVSYFLVYAGGTLWHGLSPSTVDNPSRALLAALALLPLLASAPRPAFIWAGLALGGIGAAVVALVDVLIVGEDRANGYGMNPIQFGYVAMVLGVLPLAAIEWSWHQRRRRAWLALMLVGSLGGMIAAALSGSRGTWLVLPVVIVILLVHYRKRLPLAVLAVLGLFLIGGVTALYKAPATGVADRVQLATHDIQRFFRDDADSSIGIRFELWQNAFDMMADRPLEGYGDEAALSEVVERSADSQVGHWIKRLDHFHNDYLDAQVKRGLIALLALLALYLYPLSYFWRQRRNDRVDARALALGGTLLLVTCMTLGLTQALLRHNSGVTVTLFALIMLWAGLRRSEQEA